MKKIILNTKLFVISIFLCYFLMVVKTVSWLYSLNNIHTISQWTGLGLGIFIVVSLIARIIFNKRIVIYLTLLVMFFSSQILIYSNREFYTSQVSSIISRENENNTYFLYVKSLYIKKDLKIVCNKQTYDSVIADPKMLYAMEYRTVRFFNYHSRLISISDGADNRGKN